MCPHQHPPPPPNPPPPPGGSIRHCVMRLKCGTRPCCMEINGTGVRVEGGGEGEHISNIPRSLSPSLSLLYPPSSPSHSGLASERASPAAGSPLSLSLFLSPLLLPLYLRLSPSLSLSQRGIFSVTSRSSSDPHFSSPFHWCSGFFFSFFLF